ncbi:MAG TPA: sterol desaturase family protein [Flammeovirgaceae bacterium]|nr:sterol desaturase family protein [Flammeovirgaceae bacterium]
MLKKVFQYGIYPAVMLSASAILIYGMQQGYNYYVVSLSTIAIFGAFIFFLERQMPYNKSWLQGDDWNLDFLYYIINYFIKIIAQFQFLWLSEWFAFPKVFPTTLPFWLQVILALTIIDFFIYAIHLFSHKNMFLWRLHAIHHSAERLYFLNGEKRHALHQILEGAPGIIVCLIIGTPQSVLVTALAILAINMFMQHTNLDYKAGFLKKIFSVAELHRWHHRADFKDAQVNYGAWLIIWDYLFGTVYDKPEMARNLGEIGIKEEPAFPKTYAKQFLYPFNSKIRKEAVAGLKNQ